MVAVMNIIPVPTLILMQLIPFLLTIAILYFVLFKPMLSYLDERDEKISGSKEKALAMQKQSANNMNMLKEKTASLRKEINVIRSEARAQVMSEYSQTLYTARKEADKEIKENAAKISTEQGLVREELKTTAREVANLIASQTLGRSVS
jgi:F-type H+-transporting ATPase subunit b